MILTLLQVVTDTQVATDMVDTDSGTPDTVTDTVAASVMADVASDMVTLVTVVTAATDIMVTPEAVTVTRVRLH